MKNNVLALCGAVAGGVVGYFAFFWVLEQGFYALALPGALLAAMRIPDPIPSARRRGRPVHSTPDIANYQQVSSRIRRKRRSLKSIGVFGHAGSQLGFCRSGVVVTKLAQDCRECRVRACELRLQTDGIAQCFRGFLQLSLLLQHRAQRVVGLGVFGPDFNCFL